MLFFCDLYFRFENELSDCFRPPGDRMDYCWRISLWELSPPPHRISADFLSDLVESSGPDGDDPNAINNLDEYSTQRVFMIHPRREFEYIASPSTGNVSNGIPYAIVVEVIHR